MSELNAVIAELKAAVPGLTSQIEAIQKRLDEAEVRRFALPSGRAPAEDGIASFVKQFAEHKEAFTRSGRLILNVPSLLETRAISSTGLYVADPATGINGAGRTPYTLRSVFRSTEAGSGAVFGVRSTVESTSPTSQATEGATKAESSYTFSGNTVPVATIAHFVDGISRQAMDDVVGLGEFLRTVLLWGLQREAERQMLMGDGTSGVMDGLYSTAQAYDTTILGGSSYKIADILAAAACQLREDGFIADFFVLHPRSWLRAILTKSTTGEYIIGGPQSAVPEQMWTMRGVISDQISANNFIVGDSSAAILRPRMDATIDISDSHDQNFKKNLLCIRAEERLVLQKLRPDAFVYGSTATSPAGI